MSTTTKTTSSSSSEDAKSWNRKVSVPISMPQSLLRDIDGLRGDVPRSVFICRILREDLKVDVGGKQPYAIR